MIARARARCRGRARRASCEVVHTLAVDELHGEDAGRDELREDARDDDVYSSPGPRHGAGWGGAALAVLWAPRTGGSGGKRGLDRRKRCRHQQPTMAAEVAFKLGNPGLPGALRAMQGLYTSKSQYSTGTPAIVRLLHIQNTRPIPIRCQISTLQYPCARGEDPSLHRASSIHVLFCSCCEAPSRTRDGKQWRL